jgi:AcrR family transcriptional regulator
MDPQVLVSVVPTSRMRIMAAARVQIENKGIMGLRVQDVADTAEVSVPLIYKYFGDRDGLLAQTLTSMYDEFILGQIDSARVYFRSLENPTVENVANMLAITRHADRTFQRGVNLQIMAASMEIPALRAQLGIIQMAIVEQLSTFIDEVQMQLIGKINAPSRPLALLVRSFTYGFALNDLLEEVDATVDDAEYINMMKMMIVHVFTTDHSKPAT